MSFVKTDEYFNNKIRKIMDSIVGTRHALKELTESETNDRRAIEANAAQIDSSFMYLQMAIDEYKKWIVS